MAKTPTVYDVAQRAGVSIATVSFAFRRPDRIRASTREAVLAAARDLGYVPNVSARGLAHGRTGALGLYSFDYLLDEASLEPEGAGEADPLGADDDVRRFPLYVDEVQRGVELECWRRGYALMIGGGGRASSGAVVTDIAGRVDGLAVFPRTVPDDVLSHIARRIPVVEVSEPSTDDGLDHVTVDNVGGMRALTAHMTRDHEMQDVAFVGALDSSDNVARFKGFRSAMRAARLPAPRAPLSHPGDAEEQAAAAVAGLLERKALPNALLCASDQDALAVMNALHGAGLRVPEDIAVTGFDGIIAGRLARPSLTTVRQPMEQLGRAAVAMLIERLGAPDALPASRQLPVHVVVRESCGCPPP